MAKKRKKINLHVKTDFQVWLFWRMFGIIILFSVFFASSIYCYVNIVHTSSESLNIRELLVFLILMCITISFLSSLLLGVFIPHKIAGPVYRMETDLKKFRTGDINKRITLRNEDPLFELAEEINSTLSFLVDKLDQDKS